MRIWPIVEQIRADVRIARRVEIAQSSEPMVELNELPMIEVMPATEDNALEVPRTIDNVPSTVRVCSFVVRVTARVQDDNPDHLDAVRKQVDDSLARLIMDGYSVPAWQSGTIVALQGNVQSWEDTYTMSRGH